MSTAILNDITNLVGPVDKTAAGDQPPDKERRKEKAELPEGVEILDPGYEAREDLSGLRVLIVDDNRFHRSLVRNALMSAGIHSQWEAEDAEQAEKLLSEQTVDLIVLDNNMPGEKGITFTERLRKGKTKCNRFIPIVMISAYGDEKVISAASNAGVHEYVLKPFNISTLVKRIEMTFRIPRDFIISPGYVGPDRRWRQKLENRQVNCNAEPVGEVRSFPGLKKPIVEVHD